MSWQKIKSAFFVEKDGKCQWVDVGLCANCNGIHIPSEDANACNNHGVEKYEDLVKRYKK